MIVLLVTASIYDTGIRIPNISLDRSKWIPNPRTFSAQKQHNLDADLPLPYVLDQIAHAPVLRELGILGILDDLESLSSILADSIRSINQDSQCTCRSGEPLLCEKDLVRNLQNQINKASRTGDHLLQVYGMIEPDYLGHHAIMEHRYKTLSRKPYARSIEETRIKKEEVECGRAALERERARILEIKPRLDELAELFDTSVTNGTEACEKSAPLSFEEAKALPAKEETAIMAKEKAVKKE